MPRRALRKIDESLDYSRHLYLVKELQQPWDVRNYFDNPDAPLEVEIGSGKGHFIHDAALASPGHNFIGTEIAHKYAAYCAAHLIADGISNACMFSGDGLTLFREFLPAASLAAVHVYFPDPWWKKRHRKRRVMQMELVRACEKCLVPGGVLHFWTDVEEYFTTVMEMMREEETILEGPFTPEVDANAWRTHFEKRTVIEGRPVYRSYFVKK